MLISMIIPVYNVEKYLRKCLISVSKQTYQNLEVIIINDGSPDNSQVIIDEFCNKFENFVCYKTENHGLGDARNYGLTKANGEYICFLDSDDYIKEDFVAKMVVAAVESKSDIIVCNNIDVFENSGLERKSEVVYSKNPVSLNEDKKILFNRVSAWGKLYNRKLFSNLKYEARVWYEDMRLTPKLYQLANQIYYLDEALLYYVIRDGSIMTSTNAKRNIEIIDAFEDLKNYFKNIGYYSSIKDELEFLMLDHVLVSSITRVILTKDQEKKRIINQLHDYVYSYTDVFENRYIKTMPMNRKIVYYCNRFKLYNITRLIFYIKNLKSIK